MSKEVTMDVLQSSTQWSNTQHSNETNKNGDYGSWHSLRRGAKAKLSKLHTTEENQRSRFSYISILHSECKTVIMPHPSLQKAVMEQTWVGVLQSEYLHIQNWSLGFNFTPEEQSHVIMFRQNIWQLCCRNCACFITGRHWGTAVSCGK